MKKFGIFALCLICLFGLLSCGKKAESVTVPDAADVVSIAITIDDHTATHLDRAWIRETLSAVCNSNPTGYQRIQDVPQIEPYIRIELQFKEGSSVLFAYEDGEKYYLEQPYQGIYETNAQLYEQLQAAPET